MSKMYNRANVALDLAKMALNKVVMDDTYLDLACFNTQQAMEFLIKAILEENGKTYDKTHNIRYLLELLKGTGFAFDKMEDLENISDTITQWEEKSRYGKGVKTMVQTVQRVHNLYENLNEAYLWVQEKNN